MASLTTAASVKEHLGITVTTWDGVITTLVTRISDRIEKYCRRTFASTAYTEDYDGNSADTLILRQFPIISVSSLKVDGLREFTASSEIDASNYWVDLEKGFIRGIQYRFPGGSGNVRVAYTAGYASIPTDVAFAAVELVSFYFNRRRSAGRASESLGGLSVSHLQDWPADIKATLDDYVSRVATR